jgi:hypothetical protein
MEYIAHRKNTIDDLKQSNPSFGVEIDIRTFGEKLILNHDPYLNGDNLEEWIKHYCHGTLILNVKEEGLEARLIDLMKLHQIDDYFFLDQSFPFIIKWSNLGIKKSAVRFSEYEPIELALNLKGQVDWVWIDCFTRCPLDIDAYIQLKDANFKICLVSPELQGRFDDLEIIKMHQNLQFNNIVVDAICTKKPETWIALDSNEHQS